MQRSNPDWIPDPPVKVMMDPKTASAILTVYGGPLTSVRLFELGRANKIVLEPRSDGTAWARMGNDFEDDLPLRGDEETRRGPPTPPNSASQSQTADAAQSQVARSVEPN